MKGFLIAGSAALVLACDDKYVKRGRDAVMTFDSGWKEELREANRSKEGASYKYAESLILQAAAMRIILQLALQAPFGHDSGHAGRV